MSKIGNSEEIGTDARRSQRVTGPEGAEPGRNSAKMNIFKVRSQVKSVLCTYAPKRDNDILTRSRLARPWSEVMGEWDFA